MRSTSPHWFNRSRVMKASSLIAPLVSFNEARCASEDVAWSTRLWYGSQQPGKSFAAGASDG
jgi:hypothetical protein